MLTNVVEGMLDAYEDNDIDSFFEFVSPRVRWILFSSPKTSGFYDKNSIRDLWYEYVDPSKFTHIDRNVVDVAVDHHRGKVTIVVDELRTTKDEDLQLLHAIFLFSFGGDGKIIKAYNFMYEE